MNKEGNYAIGRDGNSIDSGRMNGGQSAFFNIIQKYIIEIENNNTSVDSLKSQLCRFD